MIRRLGRARCPFQQPERDAFRRLLDLGLKDAFRLFEQPEKFSWWDYRMMAFRRNTGLRIDHILLSPALANGCLPARSTRRRASSSGPPTTRRSWQT